MAGLIQSPSGGVCAACASAPSTHPDYLHPFRLQTVAANCVSDRVSVVHRDIACLQRGRDVRALGVNLVVADLFDAGGQGGEWEGPGELCFRGG